MDAMCGGSTELTRAVAGCSVSTSSWPIDSTTDALFIPEGWWHQVDSDASTMAVNFWFDGLQKQLTAHVPKAMTPYCLRVLLQDEVKRGSEQYLDRLRKRALDAEQSKLSSSQHLDNSVLVQRFHQATEQQAREQVLIAASALGDIVLESVEFTLAALAPSEWRAVLENASEDLAALLTESWDDWDRPRTVARDGDEGTVSTEQFLETLFSAFSDDASEQIRASLLDKQSAFEAKICAQVVADTLGLRVLP